ncbi:hypothetical protein GALMADRAFT_230775 [Galerina marginata CBS 339.88]|uniref:SWIM-type domain-containing protein n=1 Tax=Galerina marginata (strain CBS 339.88) TaxID=685588 RepID=A0A067SNH5_GALM3|nr:hypothetical protein GALMADRAFT_230775 [Galerina marginata CBS 339.88]
MVLSKRKRNGEFEAWTPPSQASMGAQGAPEAPDVTGPSPKKTRTNPTRSSRTTTSETVAPAPKPAPVKKPRATRAKKAPAAKQVTPPVASSSAPVYQAGPSQSVASTSYAAPSASAPVKKGRGKGKKKADPDEDPSGSQPEKRQAIFKPKCPQNIWDRVERVMTQRIFMIDRQRNGDELREEFSVLGSTGNVYTVVIDHKPRCNCPDAVKGNHCKHILFIFLKVLQVAQQSSFWYQKALLTTELEDIFRNAPLAPNSVAHAHIREAHARATGKIPADAPPLPADEGTGKKRIPGPDDDCPVCYDGMHGVAEASLVFCEECGNALHKECFGQWQRTAKSNGKDLTCVWCRANWVVAPAPGAGGVNMAGATRTMHGYGYLNLAGVSGVSPVRDTSTYYHGPRRGQHYYGWQDYD